MTVNEKTVNQQIKSFSEISNDFLKSGYRVKDKAGGPEVVVIGFTNNSGIIADNGNIMSQNDIFKKIYLNNQRKPLNQLDRKSNSDEVSSYHFFNDDLDNWSQRIIGSDNLYIVCKYWSQKEEKYIHSLKNLTEVEII